MKKVFVVLSLFAFVGFLVTPTVMAYSGVSKVAVHDDPPKSDKKDAKCDPAKCSHSKDAKEGKSCCAKGKAGCDKEKAGCDKSKAGCEKHKAGCDKGEKKAEEKAPVPNK